MSAKVPGNEKARERKGQGTKGPGSESSRERIDQGPIGRFAPGSELARERRGCESPMGSKQHFPGGLAAFRARFAAGRGGKREYRKGR